MIQTRLILTNLECNNKNLAFNYFPFFFLSSIFFLYRYYRSDESASEQESSDEVDSDTEGLGILSILINYAFN